MSNMHFFNSPTLRLAHMGITVFERGWLSSNNVLFQGDESTAMVDSGYCTHSGQTVALVQGALNNRPLDLLINTHLHSDHCGGNAALQSTYPKLGTLIPPGQAHAVSAWDPVILTHEPTGQLCPPFHFQDVLVPGCTVLLGDIPWEIHAAKGHDPHSVVLFEPSARLLISADALWENGFGVVFPELDGINAFDEVAETLTLIERLNPVTVIPGHGAVFDDLKSALKRARTRLEQFVESPEKHRRYALKVLLKFKLLEWQSVSFPDLYVWYSNTPYLSRSQSASRTPEEVQQFLNELVADLIKSGAAKSDGDQILNV